MRTTTVRRLVGITASSIVLVAGSQVAAQAASSSVSLSMAGASLAGTITWKSRYSYSFSGVLRDTACDGQGPHVTVVSSKGYQWAQRTYAENYNGCRTSKTVTASTNSSPYSLVHISVELCNNNLFPDCVTRLYDNPYS